MSENNASLTILNHHIKEHNKLLSKHNALLIVHTKTVNDYADKCMAYDEIKRLLKEAQKECRMVQQSLDDAQTEIERLNEKIESLYDCGQDLRDFNLTREGG